ncbi:hypothetical protein T492DRAFT_846626 [Pavlovales sp. CCMP2436]|nr:hypothetical protein T492DRAFT_846626 [Pavlovales sp. CCMP2436]
MTPQLAAAAAARALFAFLFIARFTFKAQSIYFHNDSTQICTRLQLASTDISDGLDLMLSEMVIMHSRDPMPACNDDAWTLAGLDSLDATDRAVDMGIYSHTTNHEGRLQLQFEDGDLSDGCKDFRSTTINLVVVRISDGSPAGVHEHSSKLTWIGASSPDCHTDFELKLPRDIGEVKDYFDDEEEQLMLDQLLGPRPRGIGEEQVMLDQLLGPHGIGDAEHYFDEEEDDEKDDGDYDFKNNINNCDQLKHQLLNKQVGSIGADVDDEDERDDGDYDFKSINPKLFTWPPVSQGLAQAIRQKDSTTEKAAVAWVPVSPPPLYQCSLVAAIRALLLPAMVVTGILLLSRLRGSISIE